MSSTIYRSALVFHGHNPPPEVAYVVRDHNGRRVFTWADVMAERRARQRRILADKLAHCETQAYKVWTAYFGEGLMGGWHAFIERMNGPIWIDRDRKWLQEPLMRLFPLQPLFPDWHEWKIEFARRFKRRRHWKQPVGVAYVWWDGWSAPIRSIRFLATAYRISEQEVVRRAVRIKLAAVPATLRIDTERKLA